MGGLVGTQNRWVGDQGEMDPWVGDQVGLELCEVHIQGSIKAEGSSDGGDNLTNQAVQIGISGTLNVKRPEKYLLLSDAVS